MTYYRYVDNADIFYTKETQIEALFNRLNDMYPKLILTKETETNGTLDFWTYKIIGTKV